MQKMLCTDAIALSVLVIEELFRCFLNLFNNAALCNIFRRYVGRKGIKMATFAGSDHSVGFRLSKLKYIFPGMQYKTALHCSNAMQQF